MTGTDIEVRYLDESEYPALTDFYRRYLPNGERVASLFEWREADPEGSGGNAPLGAFEHGRLLGSVNLNRTTIQGLGRRQEASWYADTIVAAEARGRGLARTLVLRATRDAPLLLAKGSNPTMYHVRTAVGFADVPGDRYMLLPLTARAATDSAKLKAAAPLLYAVSRLRRRRPAGGSLDVREVARFGEYYDALAEKGLHAPYVSAVKGSAYLNWRYARNPLRDYRILEASRGGRPGGAVVLRGPTDSNRDAWIVDLLAPLGDRTLTEGLLDAARAWAAGEGADTLRAFATAVEAQRALRRAGFLTTPRTPHFTYFQRSAAEEMLPPAGADWSFWHGDSDNEVY